MAGRPASKDTLFARMNVSCRIRIPGLPGSVRVDGAAFTRLAQLARPGEIPGQVLLRALRVYSGARRAA